MIRTAEPTSTRNSSFRKLSGWIKDNNASFAFWKLPGDSTSTLLLSHNSSLLKEVKLEELCSGFLFAPFKPEAEKIFLKADHLFELKEEEIRELTNSDLLGNLNEKEEINFYGGPKSLKESPENDFQNLVIQCKEFIQSGHLEKIVASRSKRISLGAEIDPIALFNRLCKAYPFAMVSLVSSPHAGTWIGASPEPLISIDRENIFRTVALAGTKPYDHQTPIEQVSWTQKEIEEQALVERFIIGCFKKIRLREYDEFGPKTFQAGNLLHLKSVFEVNLNEVRYPELGTVMLHLLHPTSAVCGMPRELALETLERLEGYDRSFYAGYLGPVNLSGETHLFVNLRCMRWLGHEALLFAGAGITGGSDPESEWRESEWKMETVRKHLN